MIYRLMRFQVLGEVLQGKHAGQVPQVLRHLLRHVSLRPLRHLRQQARVPLLRRLEELKGKAQMPLIKLYLYISPQTYVEKIWLFLVALLVGVV
ncbi:hypothetical protein SAY87_011946 [Trapa incisa]|uniref:Uncharacterized protein n=1 Tax=Trapa incisa TaxID=236973 RepID=A0AAN7GX67_9MYRT|nr:hypothetical protein SAY87_011946 [Trapa incisa]